ncbi:glycosyltransferase family 4 protein [Sphingomonas sp.]|uniref:glycosyltransferase family 4 protein n=1 Tax=Sphingomonas sp. TaxID=28214 RepID=UPI002FCA35B8
MAAPPLRAAVIANGDPRDPNLWSGTPSHMLAALEKRFDVALVVQRPWPFWYRPLGRALKLLSGLAFEYSWSRWYSALAARSAIRRMRAARPDVVFAVALTDMAYLFVDRLPVVYVTDATIPDLIASYEMFQRISLTAQRKAIAAERHAFKRSFLIQLPSRWARRSAVEKQGAPEDRIAEIAWGANITLEHRSARAIGRGPVRLLFVGTDWERKGGAIALETIEELNRRGIDARLDVVGRSAAAGNALPNVIFHGFIDKRTAAGRAHLEGLYAGATFLLLPSLAEAYGIVFAEAAHHGLPSLAYAIGGVTSVVLDGKTGVLLPAGARGGDFADEVERLLNAPEVYAQMSQDALDDAKARLNWDVWAEKVEAAVRSRLSR